MSEKGPVTKHQNLATGKDPYAGEDRQSGTGETRNRLAHGGHVHHGVHGHGEHGHSHMHEHTHGHHHGHEHQKKHGK